MVRTTLRHEGNVKMRYLAKYNNEVLMEKRLEFLFNRVISKYIHTNRSRRPRRRHLIRLAFAIEDTITSINLSVARIFAPIEVRYLRFITQAEGTFPANFRFKK
jgi:hypothetical protein